MMIDLITLEDSKKAQVDEIIEQLTDAKQKAAESGDEDKANNCWRDLEALQINLFFISAFHNIKNKAYRDAWNELEQCEIKCEFLSKNTTAEYLDNTRVSFIKDRVAKWQSLFPYRVFGSPEFKIGFSVCSICGHKVRPRSRCAHKKGKIYNGELCMHIAHDLEFIGLSIVSNPVQKYSVMHNDETLDFTPLEYLSSFLENCFVQWDLEWAKKKFPTETFKRVKQEDNCPCNSGKNFEDCCISQEEIEIPHARFILSKPIPSNIERAIFPY